MMLEDGHQRIWQKYGNVNESKELPDENGQFGGFIIGQSRNTNATYEVDEYGYGIPDSEGWRVWSIDDDVVTLISAGIPEAFYNSGATGVLENRNCNMYENSYAEKDMAHILRAQEVYEWYNKQFGTEYQDILELSKADSFSSDEPIDLLANGAEYYMVPDGGWTDDYYFPGFYPDSNEITNRRYDAGIRIMIPLKTNLQTDINHGDGSIEAPYKLFSPNDIEAMSKIDVTYVDKNGEDNIDATQESVYVKFKNITEDNTLSIKYQIGVKDGRWLDYSDKENTGIEMSNNGYVYARLVDTEGNLISEITAKVDNIDTQAPNNFNLLVSATKDSITIETADVINRVVDNGNEGLANLGNVETAVGKKGVREYRYQVKNNEGKVLIDRIQSSPIITFTAEKDGIKIATEYKVSMMAIDNAGNIKEAVNKDEKVTTGLQVGDYVNYNAGIWTSEDISKIISSEGCTGINGETNDDIIGNQKAPNIQGQFGGFEIGDSKDISSKIQKGNRPVTDGWRVWDINENDGTITLISAGNPELYSHKAEIGNADKSTEIFKQRDCSMYVNNYATSAKLLTGELLANWWNKNYKTNYSYADDIRMSGYYNNRKYLHFDVLDNGSWFFVGEGTTDKYFLAFRPSYHRISWYDGISANLTAGVRVLVTLKNTIDVDYSSGDGKLETKYNLIELE